jgi:hypothetical protein
MEEISKVDIIFANKLPMVATTSGQLIANIITFLTKFWQFLVKRLEIDAILLPVLPNIDLNRL